jgi:polyribonucleotide nucleotidyltransferase
MLDFGAVVEYLEAPKKYYFTYLIAWERTENVSDVVNMGDVFQEILRYGSENKKRKVSRKALMPRPPREERKE